MIDPRPATGRPPGTFLPGGSSASHDFGLSGRRVGGMSHLVAWCRAWPGAGRGQVSGVARCRAWPGVGRGQVSGVARCQAWLRCRAWPGVRRGLVPGVAWCWAWPGVRCGARCQAWPGVRRGLAQGVGQRCQAWIVAKSVGCCQTWPVVRRPELLVGRHSAMDAAVTTWLHPDLASTLAVMGHTCRAVVDNGRFGPGRCVERQGCPVSSVVRLGALWRCPFAGVQSSVRLGCPVGRLLAFHRCAKTADAGGAARRVRAR